ncbi:MFS transporter [Rathayibacter iranicus]|uniref:MFS transporter n=2 Tax=Rathayibacter iranicus TaxID=59737 RepID=A0AAD1AF10_9MICO|nr:MFS transporter [Rathayibacter iranicus]AZZ56978.1 MFS transporter [Rathayibacter iranicus]MWV29586.1 MFS transporter [Rathayibacter iranicus NCPPB 2253 = VKM Ac-1602]PPI41902.1 MFS transporter [Rathayibacter iranicus]PPI57642.1 MFS transporter [Rathayibacter iranicus]PPI68622.1 MFS transporter [Rathayibacter iranicus]
MSPTRVQTSPPLGPALRALLAAQVLASTAAGLVLTTASVAAVALSGTEQVAGATQTAMVVGASALTVPLARLSERFGRRAALSLAYSCAAAGALVGAAAIGLGLWWLLVLGTVLIGGGTVAGLAARFAAAEFTPAPERTATMIALVLWASTVGSLVGPNLAAVTAGAASFVLPAVLYGAAAACVRIGLPTTTAALTRPVVVRANAVTVLRAHPRARAGVAISVASHAVMIALMALAPVHLHHAGQHGGGEHGTDEQTTVIVGIVLSGHLAAMYGFSPLFGLLVRRWGALRSGAAGLALTAVAAGILAVAATSGPLLFGIGLALLGAAWSLGTVAGSTLVTLDLGPADRAAAQSATDLLLNVGGGAASIAAGLVVAATGYVVLAASATGLVLCCLAGLLLAVHVGARRREVMH